MAEAVIMPRQGQSVETCFITSWKKQVGDDVAEGDILCEIETDKASFEVESTASGKLLDIFFPEGEDVPVLMNICAIGQDGDDVSGLRPEEAAGAAAEQPKTEPEPAPAKEEPKAEAPQQPVPSPSVTSEPGGNGKAVSPRARKLAASVGIDASTLSGTGPKDRVIERDVQAVLDTSPPLTAAARNAVAQGGNLPESGTGIGGRATLADVQAAKSNVHVIPREQITGEGKVTEIPVKGIRKLISDRMLQSLQTTAQLTLNASADARSVLAMRKKFKGSGEDFGLQGITVNDIILFAVSRTLMQFPELNALFEDGTIYQYEHVHLAFAVDSPRGLMVPVLRHANLLSMKQISDASKELVKGCVEGGITPEELQGGTFTITNLGAMGIENFTPVLNPPQVGILGIGKADLKPVMGKDGAVEFIPHFALSLTINHQVVDGAPAARFLQALGNTLSNIDVYMAI